MATVRGLTVPLAILTGELSQLIPDLLEALGGEMEPGVAAKGGSGAGLTRSSQTPLH